MLALYAQYAQYAQYACVQRIREVIGLNAAPYASCTTPAQEYKHDHNTLRLSLLAAYIWKNTYVLKGTAASLVVV